MKQLILDKFTRKYSDGRTVSVSLMCVTPKNWVVTCYSGDDVYTDEYHEYEDAQNKFDVHVYEIRESYDS